MSTDDSIKGLLLRVHAEIAGQRHGEEFIHHNVRAMNFYEQALQSVQSAIKSVAMAEVHQFGKDIYGNGARDEKKPTP